MDVEQQPCVAIMFGARFESILVPLVFELEYKVAELFLADEAVGLLGRVGFFPSINVNRFFGFVYREGTPASSPVLRAEVQPVRSFPLKSGTKPVSFSWPNAIVVQRSAEHIKAKIDFIDQRSR